MLVAGPKWLRSAATTLTALKERDAEGDQAKAISLLDEFLAISSELEMLPLTKRVLARKL